MQSLKTTAQVRRLIVDSINKALRNAPADSLPGNAKHIDYEIGALLPAVDNKTEFCKQILAKLHTHTSSNSNELTKDFLAKLKIYLLGKLFYLSLQDKRYLLIQNFSSRANHKFMLDAVSQIEASAENAALFLDSLSDPKQKDFFIGITSYIYN
ncbi:MAG: hypothetical protein LBD62_05190 [Candidatus Margulisbacteria bacterium]|nr:hypothetical protein [Candidatus Margulisiibacteriota bacterium]